MKYKLSDKIIQRILTDNEFSLELSLLLNKRQESVIRLAKRDSNVLRLPESVEFFIKKGYPRAELFQNTAEKSI